VEGGLDAATPVAVIQEGTTERERTIIGTLADIAERAAAAGLSSPALTVIGTVVNLSEILKTARPLYEQHEACA
jgi:siroheme synthase